MEKLESDTGMDEVSEKRQGGMHKKENLSQPLRHTHWRRIRTCRGAQRAAARHCRQRSVRCGKGASPSVCMRRKWQSLAFLTIAFDSSYTGESSGTPRHVASPDIIQRRFCAAVDIPSPCRRMLTRRAWTCICKAIVSMILYR